MLQPKNHDRGAVIAAMAKRDNLERVNMSYPFVQLKDSFYTRYGKRVLDFTIGFIVSILTLPINLILGILTYIDVGMPLFFKQRRIGKDGKVFNIIKFRNMRDTKDLFGNLLPPEERVTKFGRLVRKNSLDELLNFWHIFKGDMSIIGPRPLPEEFIDRYSNRHKLRHAVRPGLECPCLKPSGSVRLYQEQFENDIWYVENVSFIIDCKLFIRLVQMVLNKSERADHASVGGGYFVGYDESGCAFSMRHIPDRYIKEYDFERNRSDNNTAI